VANLDLLNEFWKRTEQEAAWRAYASSVRRRGRSRSMTRWRMWWAVDAQSAGRPPQVPDLVAPALSGDVAGGRLRARTGSGRVHRRDDESPYWITKKPPERIGWLLTETPQGSIAVTRVARVEDPVSGEAAAPWSIPRPCSIRPSTSCHGQSRLPLARRHRPSRYPGAIRAWNRTPLSQASSVGLVRDGGTAMDDPTFAAYRNAIAGFASARDLRHAAGAEHDRAAPQRGDLGRMRPI
jgi:hypothetical protein